MSLAIYFKLIRVQSLMMAFISVLCGNALAVYFGNWGWGVGLLTLLSAILLQATCNICNEYGDAIRGTDAHRPERIVGHGGFPLTIVKRYIYITGIATIISGLVLLFCAPITPVMLCVFLGLGVFSLLAAVMYTIGRYAYAYYGLGDLFCFLCFGLVGVIGSFMLHGNSDIPLAVWVAAIGAGCFITSVLNINNVRDIETDRIHQKMTLPARLGWENGKKLQIAWEAAGYVCYIVFVTLTGIWQSFLWILLLPLLIKHMKNVLKLGNREQAAKEFDPTAILASNATILFSIGIFISYWMS